MAKGLFAHFHDGGAPRPNNLSRLGGHVRISPA